MKKPTQKEVVKQMLLNNEVVCGSSVYKKTKQLTGVGSLNCHKQLAALRDEGYVTKYVDAGTGQHKYREHFLDRKKTPKKLLQNKS